MADLVASGVSVHAREVELLGDVSMALRPGELVAILGPNGAGKTTMLRALLGLQALSAGTVKIGDVAIANLPAANRARQISYLPQRRPLAWPNTVRDVVALGRFAHGATLGSLGHVDAAAVDAAIVACDLEDYVDRRIDSLSGGELARVHFSRVIAADAPLLIADEPIAALDPRHQLRIVDLIRKFVNDGGGALVVLHEVALAARCADRLIWMSKGRIVADGSPSDTLTEQRMRDVYGVSAQVMAGCDGRIDVRIESAT